MTNDEIKKLASKCAQDAVNQQLVPLLQENKELHTLCQQLLTALKAATKGNKQ